MKFKALIAALLIGLASGVWAQSHGLLSDLREIRVDVKLRGEQTKQKCGVQEQSTLDAIKTKLAKTLPKLKVVKAPANFETLEAEITAVEFGERDFGPGDRCMFWIDLNYSKITKDGIATFLHDSRGALVEKTVLQRQVNVAAAILMDLFVSMWVAENRR